MLNIGGHHWEVIHAIQGYSTEWMAIVALDGMACYEALFHKSGQCYLTSEGWGDDLTCLHVNLRLYGENPDYLQKSSIKPVFVVS